MPLIEETRTTSTSTRETSSSMLLKARALGMKDEEYSRVEEILGRIPTSTELAMYSVEWSEHCGYPRSKWLLRTLPKKGHYASLSGADTGGIEIEPGLFIVFKMESHNHPSQVEPRQGAATGIGGIVRDIFTCGARPIACLDSLRFGSLTDPEHGKQARYLFAGVVEGISWYGNSIGVPTVGGEIAFNPSFRGNCLVGAMSVGVVKRDEIASGAAAGPGNSVMYFGNATGRDGIGGCSVLASHEMSDSAARPTVQVGDPFAEKCLIEACLEALKTGAIVSMKDMGAAGLTCTTCEQAAEGGVGMDVNLDLVPLREADMEAFEIMMSESQERMLAVVEKGREEEVASIFRRWGQHAVAIGSVRADGILRVSRHGEVVAEMTAHSLADAPTYMLPFEEPKYLQATRSFDFSKLPIPSDWNQVLVRMLSAPNIASKEWAYRQYDHSVQVNSVVIPGDGDAAVIRVRESASGKGIALKADCNSRYCYLDPFEGARLAVVECARNLICVGAEPAGVTDCLCFGNPEKPERFWQFKRAIEGIVDICTTLHLPVVSGNVSLYNETAETAVHPSPLIGMVGVLPDVNAHTGMAFRNAHDLIVLLGDSHDELGGSEYAATIHDVEAGVPPRLNLPRELAVQKLTVQAIRAGLLHSAHDCSDGGLAVALAESAIVGNIGARIELPDTVEASANIRLDSLLFGESQSRIVVSLAPEHLPRLQELARAAHVPLSFLGTVGGERFVISDARGGGVRAIADLPVAQISDAWKNSIARIMEAG
jgi:phosphoribosylformylglycinamidine synthase